MPKELSKLSESWNGTRAGHMSYKLFHSTAYNLTGDPDPVQTCSQTLPRFRLLRKGFHLTTTPRCSALSISDSVTNEGLKTTGHFMESNAQIKGALMCIPEHRLTRRYASRRCLSANESFLRFYRSDIATSIADERKTVDSMAVRPLRIQIVRAWYLNIEGQSTQFAEPTCIGELSKSVNVGVHRAMRFARQSVSQLRFRGRRLRFRTALRIVRSGNRNKYASAFFAPVRDTFAFTHH